MKKRIEYLEAQIEKQERLYGELCEKVVLKEVRIQRLKDQLLYAKDKI